MSGLIGGNSSKTLRVKEFRTSGTFTVPSGVKTVGIFLVGGGGSGIAQFGGQGGNVVEVNYDVAGKATCAVVIGSGGTLGGTGGSSSFDGVVVAAGGGGQGSSNSATITTGGGPVGRCGFGGTSGDGYHYAASNGAISASEAGANTGAGGAQNLAGGSGYCRVEWYE